MTGPGVVLVSRDGVLVADVTRLCTLAGLVATVAVDVAAVQSQWADAALVLVDAAQAAMVIGAGLPRRSGLVMLTTLAPTPATWAGAVELGAAQVVELPAGERFLADALINAAAPQTGGGHCVVVAAASGGAGATTVAVAVSALAARRGQATALVDTDSIGGGIDLLLGVEHASGLRWPDLADVDAPLGAAPLRAGLVVADGVAILSADRETRADPTRSALAAVVRSLRRDGVVVVDTARWIDPASVAAAGDLCLLVVSATVRSVVAAAARVPELGRVGVDLRLVVRTERRAGLSPTEVADAVGAPVAAVVAHDRAVAQAADAGRLATAIPGTTVGRALAPTVASFLAGGPA